jgi:hypothetical protein
LPLLASRVLTLALGVAALCAPGMAQETGIAARLHPWGRFEPGTWKTVRVVTETLNEQGQVVSTSTTDIKTTLANIDTHGVTLEVETCVEVAGKRFQSDPQVIVQGFHGEAMGPSPKLKEPADGELAIENRKIPCKIQEVTIDGPNGKTTVTLHYSMTIRPYVLNRVSVTADPDGKNTVSETNTEVIALDMPTRVQGETRSGAYVKTVHNGAKTTVTTLAVVLPEVPGGVVSQSSKELDKNGQLVRRSTLELLDYNADPDKDHSGIFGRKRPNRRTKQPTRYGP